MRTIAESWRDFTNTLLKDTTDPQILDDMRVTFYCGALALLEINLGSREMSEEERVDALEAAYQELTAFDQEMREKGKQH